MKPALMLLVSLALAGCDGTRLKFVRAPDSTERVPTPVFRAVEPRFTEVIRPEIPTTGSCADLLDTAIALADSVRQCNDRSSSIREGDSIFSDDSNGGN